MDRRNRHQQTRELPIKKPISVHSRILKNESGIAIGMVLTAVVLLTTIVANFTFDININKIKSYNIEDRAKAKLTAESGLKFAMARLRLYKEAYNYLQKNKAAKDLVKQKTLNSIWNFPFVYPVPVTKEMNQVQKDSIKKFTDESFIEGTMQLTINNISNRINLNALRISLLQQSKDSNNTELTEEEREFSPENQLTQTLALAIKRKSEKDDTFFDQYQNVEAPKLVNELKFFSSDSLSNQDSADVESDFQNLELTPKKAPLNSYSELYTLPNWPDELVNIVRNEFTVHGAVMVDLNKITDKFLRVLIPNISDEEVKEFYKYKDDPEDPHFFNTLEDFKKYIVDIGNVLSSSKFDEIFKFYQKQGLEFGPTPTLFKVISSATSGRATYKLTAFIVLPATPKKEEKPTEPAPNENGTETKPADPNKPETPVPPKPTPPKEEEKTLLLNPRIVEINVS